jgi:hypothetical protein
MQPERLSRTLRASSASGVVEIDGRRLPVASRARLAAQLQTRR